MSCSENNNEQSDASTERIHNSGIESDNESHNEPDNMGEYDETHNIVKAFE